MQIWRTSTRGTIRQRGVALLALVTFALGNVGWPLTPGSASGRKNCRNAVSPGRAACCCGTNVQRPSCGCGKAPVVAKTAGCCQKKLAAAQKSRLPALTCNCGESTVPGFIVSSQPKLGTPAVEMPKLADSLALSPASTTAAPQGGLPPETPPPRPSVG